MLCRVLLRDRARRCPPSLKPEDVKFLEDCARRSFGYFWDQLESAHGSGARSRRRRWVTLQATMSPASPQPASVSRRCALPPIAAWVPKEQARQHVLTTLRFLWGHAFHDHGWYLHFMDADTGERRMNSEVSSIDTALLLAGVLTAQGYFSNDREIRTLAREIFERVDFAWMLNGSPTILSHGVKPGSGFLEARWQTYSEASILYLLGIGSPRHSIPVDSWYAWLRPEVRFDSWKFVSGGALFTHQYSHAWIDFRHLRDGDPSFIDYFQNSQIATYRSSRFLHQSALQVFRLWAEHVGRDGFRQPTGLRGLGRRHNDHADSVNGTLVPCAAAGSLMFTPEICLACSARNVQPIRRQDLPALWFCRCIQSELER